MLVKSLHMLFVQCGSNYIVFRLLLELFQIYSFFYCCVSLIVILSSISFVLIPAISSYSTSLICTVDDMTNLLPDDSYCTSEIGKLLFLSKNDCPATVRLISATDETLLGVTYTSYNLEFKFIPKESLLDEPRLFHISTRYKEVNRLQAQLSKLHKQLYLRGSFPIFPAPKLFGKADEATIEERKRATVQVFEFTVDSEVLRKSRVLHEFVQKATEVVVPAQSANVDAFLFEGASDIMDTPASNLPLPDIGSVLEPTRDSDDTTNVPEASSPTTHQQPSSPDRDIGSPDSLPEFHFPDLAVTLDRPRRSEEAPSAIRRLFNKMPMAPGFSNRGQPPPTVASDYLVQAAKLVSTAQRAEMEHEYELAFHCLKAAAQSLIEGVQTERDLSLRNTIRRKTAKYLVRAERLYRAHLAYDGSTFNFDALYAATAQDPNIMAFQCSNSQLKNYRILGVAPDLDAETRVFVVEESGSGTRFAMKLLQKGGEANGHTFLSTNVPHMVHLYKFFQTEVYIILLLEWVETGRLWSFLVRYFNEATKHWTLYEEADARVQEETQSEEGGGGGQIYKGKRVNFSVGIDYERLARMEQQALNENQSEASTSDDHSELCTVGVDVVSEYDDVTGEDTHSNRQQIVVPGPAAEDELQIRVDEEAPARLRLTTPKVVRPSEDSVDAESLTTLSACLSECSSRLGSTRRRAWPSHKKLPECLITHWTAQMVSMFYVLHNHGECIGDLMPDNLLISNDGNLLITYYALWNESGMERKRFREGYSAPECFEYPVRMSSASDVWTLGAILYELLTGRSLREAAPHGVGQYIELPYPDHCNVSFAAKDIVQRMLCEDEVDRATLDEIRMHPFYSTINWNLYDNPHSTMVPSKSSCDPPCSSKSLAPALTPEQLIPNMQTTTDVSD